MSVRLLRESSDTPNITNRDDTRMIRYAYGGSNGVVKNFGDELAHSTSGSKFILNSGMVVLQGWEVEVANWELDLSTVTGTQYHLVYLEVNVAAETAVIKSTYLTGSVPSIDVGNDLTKYPQGTARIPLYSFRISGKTISSVSKKFSVLEHTSSQISTANSNIDNLKTRMTTAEKDIDNLETRLSKLGFREGSVGSLEFSSSDTIKTNIIKRQGNYVIGHLSVDIDNAGGWFGNATTGVVGVIPENFRPAEIFYGTANASASIGYISGTSFGHIFCNLAWDIGINKDTGVLARASLPPISSDYLELVNMEISSVDIHFAYEAAPLT